MIDQDFERFKVLCPLQTRVKGQSELEFVRDHGNLFIKGLEGIVVRHGHEVARWGKKGTTWIDIPVVMFFDNPHEWDVRPADLLYWVGGEYITLEALLTQA